MKLRGIEFGNVFGASGVQGFFGEGYPYHTLLAPFGLTFRGCTFVAKTTTLNSRDGNMPLNADLTPKDFKPRCIVAKPFKGVALNAVDLSGPGAQALFQRGLWQKRTDAFYLSFMSVGAEVDNRLNEAREFSRLLQKELPRFQGTVGLQINVSCPNVGLNPGKIVFEAAEMLDMFSRFGIPLELKLNVMVPVKTALEIAKHPACDSLCMSNTIPWGSLPDRINWRKLFGSETSPLAQYNFGNGGLSGKPLLPLVVEWIREARAKGLSLPINACGGILSKRDVLLLKAAGATAISIGSVAFLRPWRVQSIINYANRIFFEKNRSYD